MRWQPLHRALAVGLTLGFLAPTVPAAGPPDKPRLPPPANRPVDYARDVKPIFARACYRCHGEKKQKSGYRLDLRATALKGGDLGRTILPGHSADSPLVRYVAGLDPDLQMPPNGERLTAEQIGLLRAWIDQGAKWPADGSAVANPADWWSLKPITRPRIPDARSASFQVRNPIDAFVLARLREKGLTPSPEADRRVLVRRVFFDLIGLPPTPEQVDAFVADPARDAYEKLIDSLLASPHYGERWGRHWLDVVHFGETHGYDKDRPRPNAWPYRDYVIRAFNADKPYGRFVREQIAGDVLYPGTDDGIEALGFLAAGPWDAIGHLEVPESKIDGKVARHLDRDDMVSNTTGTFLSLTVHCAQCHNHKFDPITQEDYYRLQAVFAALDRADRPYDPADRVLFARQAGWRRKASAARAKVQAILTEARHQGGQDVTAIGKALAGGIAPRATVDDATELLERRRALIGKVLGEAKATEWRAAEAAQRKAEEELRKLTGRHPIRIVYAGTVHTGTGNFRGTGAAGGQPRDIHILTRGDVTRPGREVGPGAIASLPGIDGRFALRPGHTEGDRRAALAAWVADPKNPLTWRSIVNRVWQYHFGRGIVDSPNDFGRMGQAPTHPELLDWLAADFRDNGQSLKALHRRIVTSSTYRQASVGDLANARIDGDNRYLWRQNRRKLEAEAVRDAILSVSGQLDRRMGGPSFQDFAIEKAENSPHYQYHLHDPEDSKSHRRAVYRFVVRSQPEPFMAALDCADPNLAVDKRNETLAPQQALALLNNRLTLVMAKHFAARVERPAGDDAGRVAAAFRLALGRGPADAERDLLVGYVCAHGLANGCRVVLNLNEFLFVD
jgi:mono/diheme cytochrome c family protein